MSVAKHLMRFSKYRDRKKTNHNPSDLALDTAGALLPHLCTLTNQGMNYEE